MGDSFKEIIELKSAAKQAHENTLERMKDRSLNKKVLLRIVASNGNEEAILKFDSLQSAQDHLHSLEILEQET